MKYTAQTVTNLAAALVPIANIASAYDYFAAMFVTAAGPASKMAMLGPPFPMAHATMQAQFATMRWSTVTARTDGRIVGFAATTESPEVAKTCQIVWFFVVPACRDEAEPVLLRHIEQTHAAGCAEILFEAELNIELWRRFLRNGYGPITVQSYVRGPPGKVVTGEMAAAFLYLLGAPLPLDCFQTARKIRAHREFVSGAVALINDELTTVDIFRAQYPALIRPGSSMPTLPFVKSLMPNSMYLPAGPAANTLPPCPVSR